VIEPSQDKAGAIFSTGGRHGTFTTNDNEQACPMCPQADSRAPEGASRTKAPPS